MRSWRTAAFLSLLASLASGFSWNKVRLPHSSFSVGATTSTRRHSSSIYMANAGSSIRASAAMELLASSSAAPSSSGGGGSRRRKKTARIPIVDSTLLRFVSQQQERLVSPPASSESRVDPQNVASAAARPLVRARIINGESSSSSADSWWWGQFNCHRIVSVLMEKGQGQLDLDAAEKAGEAVQSQALARKARRQIRSFLKERDRALMQGRGVETMTNGSNARNYDVTDNSSNVTSDSSMATNAQQPLHAFEESVDVMLELGLTIKDVADILQHTPGIALMRPKGQGGQGETLETTLTRVLNLLGTTLKLRRYDARKVIRTCPGLLTMRRSKAAEHSVLIMSKLGVSANSLSRDLPALSRFLLRPPASLFRLVSFLASDAIRMPTKQIGPLIRRRECLELLDCVAPVPSKEVLSATSTEDDDDEDDLVDTVDPTVANALWGKESIQRRKQIDETYKRMSETAWTLRHEIGTKDLSKVIAAYPSVLLLDAKDKILPNAAYLMDDLGIWEDDLPKVLQLYPTLLGMELASMRRVTRYLLSLEVPDENIPSIFRSFPALLTLDVEKDMQPVVEFLRSLGIRNLGRFISRLPPILGYSVERELLPKWNYLAGVCADPRFEVSKFPAFFSYPLERVIKTRYEYIRRVKGLPTQFLAVDQVLSFGDQDFATKVIGDLDEGKAFKEFCERRKTNRHKGVKRKQKGASQSTKPSLGTTKAKQVPIESRQR